jgi:hypothetical protein
MPTLNKDARQALYAVAGAADLAVSTIRHLPEEVDRFRARLPGEAAKAYDQLVRRGESLITGARRSQATQQATGATRSTVSRTRAASTRARRSAKATRTSAKAAGTSVRRAAGTDAKAARDAATKVGEN